MRKIITCGLLAAAALSAATPAFAADDDTNFGGGVNAANNWNFTTADVCTQEVAVVPALSDWSSSPQNTCANGNVIDHSDSGQQQGS
ncbi:hypothetical protein [Streptomyces sp. NPDC006879]|uniref:hypothetical protein n=1 Tax=Streptomyces sp. NPDC006879 TaxID=3364767 RepID=UPI0036CFD784